MTHDRPPSEIDDSMTELLHTVVRITAEELPFMSFVARLALDAGTDVERHAALLSLYRLGLEHEQPYVADLADELLRWVEGRTTTRA